MTDSAMLLLKGAHLCQWDGLERCEHIAFECYPLRASRQSVPWHALQIGASVPRHFRIWKPFRPLRSSLLARGDSGRWYLRTNKKQEQVQAYFCSYSVLFEPNTMQAVKLACFSHEPGESRIQLPVSHARRAQAISSFGTIPMTRGRIVTSNPDPTLRRPKRGHLSLFKPPDA